MTQLWLVRHGQTDWNREGRWQGQAAHAPPLNEIGRAQAEAMAEKLESAELEVIYSSDLPRARETAEIIARRFGLPVIVDPRLREIDLGVWEGMRGDDIAGEYPEDLAERERNPAHSRAPEGESATEVAERVWAAADDIARAHPEGAVLIVSHGLALAALICRARGLSLSEVYALVPDNAHPYVIEWAALPSR
jgi:broad specificity phosphatase PhoE